MIIEFKKKPVFHLADGSTVEATGVTVHGTNIDGTVVSVTVEGITYPIANRPSTVRDDTMLNMQSDDCINVLLGYDDSAKPVVPASCFADWDDDETN